MKEKTIFGLDVQTQSKNMDLSTYLNRSVYYNHET